MSKEFHDRRIHPFDERLIAQLIEEYNKHSKEKMDTWKSISLRELRKELEIHIFKWQQFRDDKEEHDLIGIITLASMIWQRLIEEFEE